MSIGSWNRIWGSYCGRLYGGSSALNTEPLLLLFSVQIVSNSFGTPWTVTRQALLSMRFPRQEHWSGLPFPSPGALPDPGTEPVSPALAGGFLTTEPPGKHFLFSLTNIQLKLSICFNYKSRPQIAAALMGLVHLSPTEAIGVFRSHCN